MTFDFGLFSVGFLGTFPFGPRVV